MTESEFVKAFVAGARWWEYHETEFTMWPSDQRLAEEEAIKRYASQQGQSSGHDDRCRCWKFPATDCNEFKGGKCLLRCR